MKNERKIFRQLVACDGLTSPIVEVWSNEMSYTINNALPFPLSHAAIYSEAATPTGEGIPEARSYRFVRQEVVTLYIYEETK